LALRKYAIFNNLISCIKENTLFLHYIDQSVIFYNEIIAVYSQNHTEQLYENNAEFPNIQARGTYSYY